MAFAVSAEVNCAAGAQGLPGRVDDLVGEGDLAAAELLDARADSDDVAVAAGRHVAGADLGDRQDIAGCLQVRVAASLLPQVLAPAYLEPDDVVGVVGNARRVRLGVADAETGLSDPRRTLLSRVYVPEPPNFRIVYPSAWMIAGTTSR